MEAQIAPRKSRLPIHRGTGSTTMQKPKKFRAVFSELKATLEVNATDHFLAEAAQGLIDLYENESHFCRKKFNQSLNTKTSYHEVSIKNPSIGKAVSRSESIDRWNRLGQVFDSRWSVSADLDIPGDGELSMDAQQVLEQLISGY